MNKYSEKGGHSRRGNQHEQTQNEELVWEGNEKNKEYYRDHWETINSIN